MRRSGLMLGVAVVLWAGAASAEIKKFSEWRDKAKPVESLAQFLTSFIGNCDSDPLTSKECKEKVDAYRKDALNKPFYLITDESAQRLVELRGFNPTTHEQEFALTPYFEAAGFALTNGQPTRTDSEGRPILPLMRMVARINESVTPMDLDRVFKTGEIRMQVVYRPQGLWRLPRKDKKGFTEGVKAQILAVRLTHARTGASLVELVTAGK